MIFIIKDINMCHANIMTCVLQHNDFDRGKTKHYEHLILLETVDSFVSSILLIIYEFVIETSVIEITTLKRFNMKIVSITGKK